MTTASRCLYSEDALRPPRPSTTSGDWTALLVLGLVPFLRELTPAPKPAQSWSSTRGKTVSCSSEDGRIQAYTHCTRSVLATSVAKAAGHPIAIDVHQFINQLGTA
jgi:hypothetical protein